MLPPDFEEVFSIEYEHVPVQLVKHLPSGMHLCLAKVKSPCVNGYFSVHTEAEDHYGCPHTLEHLVFMGSKRYPYKGVLDLLANQCLAQGTNAWTDTDNTTYTVETAGAEGFLNIFPIYMDHLLYPTLRESAFMTEVHHVDGEGADAGVVYCEMQARENEMEDIVEFTKRQMLFSDKNKSLKAETGGRLFELRNITNKMIQDYHRVCYMPSNICAVVCGQCDMRDLCEKLQPVLDRYPALCGGMPQHIPRPFSVPVEVLTETKYKEISFPAEDDGAGGCFTMSWFGPKWEQFDEILAIETLFAYLSQDSISALRKAFCDVPLDAGREPLCADVDFGKTEVARAVFSLELASIDVAQLKSYISGDDGGTTLDRVILGVMREAVMEAGALDMERMRSLLELGKRRHLQRLESSPHDAFSDVLLSEFLFGPTFKDENPERTGATLLSNMRKVERFDRLLAWPEAQWKGLLDTYFLSNSYVALLALPSKDAAAKLQEDEKVRLEQQKAAIGQPGLKANAEQLEKAEAANDMEVPEDVKREVGLPDLRKVQLIPCKTLTTRTSVREACKNVEESGGPVAKERGDELATDMDVDTEGEESGTDDVLLLSDHAKIQFDSVEGAQFCDVRYVFHMDVEKLAAEKPELLKVLPIWKELAFESPLKASQLGAALTAEETVKKCTDVFNSTNCKVSEGRGSTNNFGMGAVATNAMVFYGKMQKSQLEEGAKLLMRVKEDTEFTEEKVKIAASRLLNQVPDEKRSGWDLCTSGGRALFYADSALQKVFSWPSILKEFKVFGSGEEGEGDEEDGEEGADEDGEEDGDEEGKAAGKPADMDCDGGEKESDPPDAEEKAKEVQAKLQDIIAKLQELQQEWLQTLALHVGGDLGERDVALFTRDARGAHPLFDLCSVKYKPLRRWRQLTTGAQDHSENLLLNAGEQNPQSACRGVVVPAASIESNYLKLSLSTQSVESSLTFEHPDFAALSLAIECFTMLEGPFWRKIRGKGFAYNYSMSVSLELQLVQFVLQKATQPVGAFEEARKIVENAVREAKEGLAAAAAGRAPESATATSPLLLDETVLNAARSGITFEVISGISTAPSILYSSYLDSVGPKRPKDRVRLLLGRLMELGSADVVRAAEKYVLPLFTGVKTVGGDGVAASAAAVPRLFSMSTPDQKKEEVQGAVQRLGWRFVEVAVPEMERRYAEDGGYAAVQAQVMG